MKNRSMQKDFRSYSCRNLQQQISKTHQKSLGLSERKKVFIPFCSQRDLGKLITKENQNGSRLPKNEDLIDRINFKNFHKIYKIVSTYENQKYSELTRKPQQPNLINHQWKLNTITKLSIKNIEKTQKQSQKSISMRQSKISLRKNNNSIFEKANQFLFKKINQVKNPQFNPEFKDMYQNYIKICEMNENIRRKQLRTNYKQRLLK